MTRLAILAAAALLGPVASAQPLALGGYREPPPEVTSLLMAPRPPEPVLHSASGRIALLQLEPPYPLERLARPWVGLAGFRFDPSTRTSGTDPLIADVRVVSTRPGDEGAFWRPEDGGRLADVRFSPDGRWLSAVAIGAGPARLALFDLESGAERRLPAPIQAAWGDPCDWVDEETLLCRLIPEPPEPAPTPEVEPEELEHQGGALPLRTYNDLLDDPHEEALFEHFFTSELARVGVDGSVTRFPESRGLLEAVVPSPDGAFAVVDRIEPPYSRMVPARRFPSVVEIWNLAERRRVYASSAKGLGVEADDDDPRRFAWRPGEPIKLGWIEKEEKREGKPRGEQWVALEAPFATAELTEIARSDRPIRRFTWTTEGTAFFSSRTRDGDTEVYVVRSDGARRVWRGKTEDRYGELGRAIRVNGGRGAILEHEGRVFLARAGLGPRGARPFLETIHVDSLERERLFISDVGVHESVVGLLDPDVPSFVTSRETEVQPPTLFLVSGEERTLLHAVPNPYPGLDAGDRRRVSYPRSDGVELRASLYLPEGHRLKAPLPTLVWIYPREFSEREFAEQIDVRHYRFHHVRGPSPLAAVLRGYAVLMHPRMPIIGSDKDVNDAYLEQLTKSAEAAVDHLVEIGVTDPERVAIAGHSYGAFSSANLLVHTDLFATGIVLSGAYNRTLTPFGFQSEKRSLWKALDFYKRVSPFFYVDELDAPILVIHGGADPNPGTPPLQARRFFHALVGVGANARFVELPFEGHNLRARESVLHVSAEMLDWLDRTLAGKEED